MNYKFAYLRKYGHEVEAEIVDVIIISNGDGGGYYYYSYGTYYEYVTENKIYGGRIGRYATKQAAEEHLGEKIIITIGPNGRHTTLRMAELQAKTLHFTRNWILAIVMSVFFALFIAESIYCGIYLGHRTKKLLKSYAVATGEVTKTFGIIGKRVKVKYTDASGKQKEKYAYHRFRPSVAKFLADKKYIKIRLYKNTFGIDEIMPLPEKNKKKKA